VKKITATLLLTAASVLGQPAIPVPPGATPPAVTTSGDRTITPRNLSNLSEADLNTVYGPNEINLKGATIDEFLTLYAETVNRIILRPGTLPAPTVTVKNHIPLTKREVIQMLDAVLGINGIAIINVGDKFAKAVPIAEAGASGQAVSKGDASSLPEWGQYVTHVVQLKYVKPSEMVPVIQPFAKIPNSILPVEANGILVIRDFAENVKRMLEMIDQVDVSVPAEYISEVIPIKYALAGEIATALNSLSGSAGGTSVGGAGSTGGTARSSSSRGSRGSLGGGGGLGLSGMNQGGQTGGVGAMGTPGGVGGAGGTFTDRLRNIINRAGSTTTSGDITVIGETKIIADERTNSLLVYATREDMKTIKDVISKLDVVLAQVLIESIILGVSADDDLELGVSAAQKPMSLGGNVEGAGIMNNDRGSLVENLTGLFATNAAANLGGLNYFGKISDDWLVAVKALSSSGKTEVLQRPVIMTTHATPGEFFVGNTVPYVTSSYYGGSSLYGPSSSYQQLRVGIQLTVTPFINPDGIVVMKIDQAIEEIDGSTKIEGVGDVPNTASRTLSADITVRDRDTIVLGGFIRDTNTKTKSGVPLLKDIPVLGFLFRSSTSGKDRRELLVLMRPTVLKTPELAAMGSDIERERMRGIHRFEGKMEEKDADFDKRMNDLDDIKPAPKQKTEDPESKRLRDAIRSTPDQQSIPPSAPAPEPSPTATTNDVSNASSSTTLAATSTESDWTQPVPTTASSAVPTQKTAKQKAKPSDPFGSVQPMTEEEIKAFGRN
jgi:general secretion pathway protein D